jgi:cytochrome P450
MNLEHIPGEDSLLELPRMLMNPKGWLRERHREYGDVWRTRWITPVVVVAGPDANQTVMVTGREHFSYHQGYGDLAIGKVFDGSLLLKDGAAHKVERDILQPAVGRLGLSQSVDRVRDIWQRGAARVSGRQVDAYEFARDVTFEVSANALVDLELKEIDEWRAPFEELKDGAMAHTTLRFPFGNLDRGLKARKLLIEKLAPRIEAARHREPHGMVGLLAHNKDPVLSNEAIAAHVLLLFWAGYDTTASTGGWMLHHLADRPDWQDRLRREAEKILGDREMSVEDQESLVEHGWFLKEIERLCPAVLFFPRRTVDEIEIKGKRVPKGTLVMWSPYLTHMTAFDDVDQFDPERFSPARGEKQAKPQHLFGFGAGPRICLGKAFAQLQLRVLLTTVLKRYRIERVSPGATLALPTHRPNKSIIRFSPR